MDESPYYDEANLDNPACKLMVRLVNKENMTFADLARESDIDRQSIHYTLKSQSMSVRMARGLARVFAAYPEGNDARTYLDMQTVWRIERGR